MKKILSTVLTVIMIFSAVIAVMPVNASAAYSTSDMENTSLTADAVKKVVNEALKYNFATAEEMLKYELEQGYLLRKDAIDAPYSMFINRYTGVVYYVNTATGEILTSNPYNVGYASLTTSNTQLLTSQISVSFFETANSTVAYDYNSTEWAALLNQISITPISGGFRVNYTLGDTATRFLLPGMATAERYEEYLLIPMINAYERILEESLGSKLPNQNLSFFDNPAYTPYEYGCISSRSLTYYYLPNTQSLYMIHLSSSSEAYNQLQALNIAINRFLTAYSCQNPAKYQDNPQMLEHMYSTYPITQDGTAIYVLNPELVTADKKTFSKYVTTYCPDYNFTMMYEDEEECGFVDTSKKNPVVKCALEYTFNNDGSLSVRLPANSIVFDETVYTLSSITPLRFFGAGDMNEYGYVFYPDGSGTVVNFDDFYNEYNHLSVNLAGEVYGSDYCYSSITGKHREQIVLPVFGLVNGGETSGETKRICGVDNAVKGYFAILEEGASLARIGFTSGGTAHKYISAYASYNPYPSDEYDLSETISVGNLGKYVMVSDSKYNGSYVTRYVMLTDKAIGDAVYGAGNYYESSYVGMANCYRDYLVDNGTLKDIDLATKDNLPLYIEAFGSMEILTKILTFPVTQKIPLTTFDDVYTMYKELSDARANVERLVAEYRRMASEEQNEDVINRYLETADMYESILSGVVDIPNVNFKLTGFANGGMYYTYPTKARWEKVVGGANGFKTLIAHSKEENAKENKNFGIFPEFDFMYINFTDLFDGISERGNVSKMVDNRYASKQEYDMVLQEWISDFTLVISPDALMRLYSIFTRDYSKYELSSMSVSTLGSDLNSNFDEDNPINRDDAQNYVVELLEKLAVTDGYDLMIDTGNIYSVKFAKHILNLPTDSSRFRYSSHTVPFVGMLLHGYVSYTGSAFNYSGSPKYDLLRSIESGASLYYILSYQNTENMKEDLYLNDYYGVDYENWYASVLQTYAELNAAIGSLQDYKIVDHKILIAERIIDDDEMAANYLRLKAEILEMLEAQLLKAIDDAFASLREDAGNVGNGVKLDVDLDTLIAQVCAILNVTEAELEADGFVAELKALVETYEARYDSSNTDAYALSFSTLEYTSKYHYITDSFATDGKAYVFTDYTVDNDSIVFVTYSNGTDSVSFILNYNIYSVSVSLADGSVYELDKYGYVKID